MAPAAYESYWRDAIDAEPRCPPLAGRAEADVALVGGGYTSLATAYFLSRLRPDLRIVLLEGAHVGFGASGRNAGMVLHELHLDQVRRHGARVVRFTYEQVASVPDLVADIAAEAGFDCELDRTGYLVVGLHAAHTRALARLQAAYRAFGVELPLLDGAGVRALIQSRRFESALVFPQAAMLHPGKYVAGLKRAVRRAGVSIHEASPVERVTDGSEVSVETPGGAVRARHVVVGLNAYLSQARLGFVRDRAVSLASFILLTEPLDAGLWRQLGWAGRQGYSDARRVHNYVRRVGQRVLFGGRVAYHFGVDSPRGPERYFARLRQELVATFPCLSDAAVTHAWSGPVAITPHRIPMIGRAGRDGRILYAVGYSGMGVALATLAGRVLADMVVGEEGRWRDLLYLRQRPLPLPPEPWRWLGFMGSYYAMRMKDWLEWGHSSLP